MPGQAVQNQRIPSLQAGDFFPFDGSAANSAFPAITSLNYYTHGHVTC